MAQLLDAWGRPIDMAALRREQAGPTTAGVRSILGSHPAQGLSPARLAALLLGAEQGDATSYLELAEEMEEKDLHYLSVLGTRKRQVAQLEITVEPASDSAADAANAELVEAFLDREELEDELFDLLDSIGKGYSVTEILWETSARQWMPARLEWRQPQWFEFERTGGAEILLREIGESRPLDPYKFVCHKTRAKSGLPIRGGIARAAAWGYLFKNFAIKDWVVFAEVFGMPIRIGKYHAGASEAQKDELLRAVANIGSDRAAIVPDGMMLELVEAKAADRSSEVFAQLAAYLDAQVSKAVLGQTLTTQEGESGSYALGKVHEAVRGDIERSDARQLAATLNRDLVRPIVELNRGPQAAYPKLKIGRAEETDIAAMADALGKLVPAGLKVSAREVRDRLGFADPEPDEEVLGFVPPEPPPGDPPVPPPPPPPDVVRAQAAPADPGEVDDAIDDLVRDALEADGWEEVLEPVVGPLRGLAESAGGYEALRAALAGALADMDSDAMAELLARSLFAARLAGETEADLGGGES
jgi:phage gp29-like protein